MLKLEITKRTDPRLLERMSIHYSKPKGFVGRNVCYAIYWNNVYYGHIVGGSATLHLQNRTEWYGYEPNLNCLVNNVFYSISPQNEVGYPKRNFTTLVLKEWEQSIQRDWFNKYGDIVIGYESLILPPRTGSLYLKAGWELIGKTLGYSCKRNSGKGTDSWGGCRVWSKGEPKLIFCKKVVI